MFTSLSNYVLSLCIIKILHRSIFVNIFLLQCNIFYVIFHLGGDTLENIGERIKLIRRHLNLNQTEFGLPIGLKQATVGQMENGSRNVTERSIIFICEKYNINETWLRTGEGNMFVELPPEDEVAAAISEVLEDIECKNAMYTLIKEFLINYQKSDTKTKNALDTYLNNVLNGYKKRKEGN